MSTAKFGASLGDAYSDKQYGKHTVIPRPDPNTRALYASGALAGNGRMGDAALPAQDLPQVVQISDWANDTYDEEQAKKLYTLAQLYLTAREKLAYVAYVGSYIAKDAALYSSFITSGGQAFLQSAVGAASTLAAFDRPNALQTFLNCTTAFETIVFPRMGIEVRGVVPQFNGRDYGGSRIGNQGASPRTIYDIGDLSMTSLAGDMDALQLISQDVKARYQLGAIPALALLFAFLVGTYLLIHAFLGDVQETVGKFKAPPPSDVFTNPAVQDALKKLPPEAQARFAEKALDKILGGNSFMDSISMVAALGIVLGVTGFIVWLFKKD
jgi:hypothetical protein